MTSVFGAGRSRRSLTAALALVVATLAGANIADASPTPTPTPTPTPGVGGSSTRVDHSPLGPEQVKEQLARASALQARLAAGNAQVAQAAARLGELSAASAKAMNAVADARAAEATARAQEKVQTDRLTAYAAAAAAAKKDVSRMAYDAYVNGAGPLRDLAAVLELTQQRGAEAQAAPLVDYLAQARSADGRKYADLARKQQAAAAAAVTARLAKQEATRAAEAAQRRVAASVTAQQQALAELQKVTQAQTSELSRMGVDVTGLGSGVDVSALTQLSTTPLCSDDNGDYPNGMIPGAALCPIDGAPGHMMRPKAARAMNAMRAAYRADTGADLCLTDTYRSYAAQVDVKARKPGLAATPGTSKHGLGLAADLCGGVEDFGAPAHQWMKRHAPLFGFYHPAWAEPTGSKPEPWHWEFAP